jgi:hypothetical protein
MEYRYVGRGGESKRTGRIGVMLFGCMDHADSRLIGHYVRDKR